MVSIALHFQYSPIMRRPPFYDMFDVSPAKEAPRLYIAFFAAGGRVGTHPCEILQKESMFFDRLVATGRGNGRKSQTSLRNLDLGGAPFVIIVDVEYSRR